MDLPVGGGTVAFRMRDKYKPYFHQFMFLPQIVTTQSGTPYILVSEDFVVYVIVVCSTIHTMHFTNLRAVHGGSTTIVGFANDQIAMLARFHDNDYALRAP